MATATVPRLPQSAILPPAQAQARKFSAADISGAARKLPYRTVYHAVEGFGKTSWAAQARNPVFLMARGETGLETLIDASQIGETPHFPELQTWEETMAALGFLLDQEHGYKTVVLDTLNGFERLCHEYVCNTEYGGDFGEKGFAGYMRGYDTSLKEWRIFLTILDQLREKGMGIIALCHTKIAPFHNPEGPDYDRYEPDMHRKTWSLTGKWADLVLFGNWLTVVATDKKDAKSGKGRGGQQRVVYCQRTAAFDAKNRLGLPAEIYLSEGIAKAAQELRASMADAIAKAKANGNAAAAESTQGVN